MRGVVRFLAPPLLTILTACGAGASNTGRAVSDSDLTAIAEAVMVEHYRLNESGNGSRHSDIFVGINGKVAPAELLARLSNARVRFRPGNEYKPGLGTSLSISNFVWTDSDHAKGDIGEVCGPLCGEGHVVIVMRKDGQWTVESLKPTWIS